jgi:DNA-binding response OmpR family regulator
MVANILSKAGYQVHTANNGRDALEQILSDDCEPFDAIVSDLEMPELAGDLFVQQCRLLKEYKKCPIIMISSIDITELLKIGVKSGADACIAKPINRSDLLEFLYDTLSIDKQDVGSLELGGEVATLL